VIWGWGGLPEERARGRDLAQHARAPRRQQISLRMRHVPTGVQVESTATGPFARVEAIDVEERLWTELWARLEAEVARKLGVQLS
jgi:hypothetical protein